VNIALLAWGSLLWKAEPLKIRDPWQSDGPFLPIEFARESDGGELPVVLCPGAPAVAVPWTFLDEADLDAACEQLRIREAIPRGRPDGVGSVSRGNQPGDAFCADVIERWRASQNLDAVIWTALPPRSAGVEGQVPSAREAVAICGGFMEKPEKMRMTGLLGVGPARLTRAGRRSAGLRVLRLNVVARGAGA